MVPEIESETTFAVFPWILNSQKIMPLIAGGRREGGRGVRRRRSFTRGPWGSGDPQELINKIILVVGYVTLIDRQMKFINLWNSSRTGIDKVD